MSEEEPELAESQKKVLQALISSNGSMPFLELASVSDMDDEQLEAIVDGLEKERLVRVINPEDVFEKIITVTGQGFSVAHMRR
jgi:DNA-binding MarR family transcriptional regulator